MGYDANDIEALVGVAAYNQKQKNWLNWDLNTSKIKPMKLKRIIPHPDYISYLDFDDISILKLSNSINQAIDTVLDDTLKTPTNIAYRPDKGTKCIVTGWGNSTHMQKARVSFIPQEECRSRLSFPADLTEYVEIAKNKILLKCSVKKFASKLGPLVTRVRVKVCSKNINK